MAGFEQHPGLTIIKIQAIIFNQSIDQISYNQSQ